MRDYKRLTLIVTLLLGSVITACDSGRGRTGTQEQELTIWVDQATAPSVQLMLNAFEADHPKYRLSLRRGSIDEIDGGIADEDSSAAITIVAPQHARFSVPIAYDNIILASEDVEANSYSLSPTEVRDILAGRITDWNQITDHSGTIHLVVFQDTHPIRVALQNWSGSEPSVSTEARTVSTSEEMTEALATEPGGLSITTSSTQVSASSLFTIDDIPPFVGSKPNNRYPIQIPIYFASESEPTDRMTAFLNWILSQRGRDVLEETLVLP